MQFTQLSPCVLFVRTRQLDENTLASDASSSSRRSHTSCLIYKSGEMGVSAGKSNLKPRQKLDFSKKFKTNFTFSISLPFFNADLKPGKSHRFIVCSWDFNHTLSYLSSVYCRITSVTTLWSSYSTCSTRKKLSERSLFAADCQPTNVIFGNSFHSHWFVVVAEHSNFLFKFRYPRSCTPPLDLLR